MNKSDHEKRREWARRIVSNEDYLPWAEVQQAKSVLDSLHEKADTHRKSDWQAIALAENFTDEVDCNSGARRRVFADGRIVPLHGDPLADEEDLPLEAAQAIKKAVDSV